MPCSLRKSYDNNLRTLASPNFTNFIGAVFTGTVIIYFAVLLSALIEEQQEKLVVN